jgi:hypothetical protein
MRASLALGDQVQARQIALSPGRPAALAEIRQQMMGQRKRGVVSQFQAAVMPGAEINAVGHICGNYDHRGRAIFSHIGILGFPMVAAMTRETRALAAGYPCIFVQGATGSGCAGKPCDVAGYAAKAYT